MPPSTFKMSPAVKRFTVNLAEEEYVPQTVNFTDLFRECTCTHQLHRACDSRGRSRSAVRARKASALNELHLVQKHQKRISGPLLDRIDIQIEVPRLSEDELLQTRQGESSRDIRARVKRARAAQAERFVGAFAP